MKAKNILVVSNNLTILSIVIKKLKYHFRVVHGGAHL